MRWEGANPDGRAARFRARRTELLFSRILDQVPDTAVDVLDVGGRPAFWELNLPFVRDATRIRQLILVNRPPIAEERGQIHGVPFETRAGDATDLCDFADRSVAVVHSNSVLEHVGNLAAQKRMADEIMRVGRHWFVQCPNRYFPLEPHFHLPWFPLWPLAVRAWLHQRWELGYMPPCPDPLAARIACEMTRLVTRREFGLLFPTSRIVAERWFVFVKSFIAIGSADAPQMPAAPERDSPVLSSVLEGREP